MKYLGLTLTLIGAVAALVNPAFGQSQVHGHDCEAKREVPTQMLGESTYNRLSRIYEDIGDEKYEEAYAALETLAGRRLNDFEQANVAQAMGFVRASQERWDEAIRHLSRAIELDQLPNRQHFEMILQRAQLYNVQERYDEALRELDIWFCVVEDAEAKQQADVWVLKASLHVQNEEFREAVNAIDTAIEMSEDPEESWYQLKLSMHFELEEFHDSVDTLKILIDMNPTRKDYWVQLSSAYMQLEDEGNAMAALRLAYRKGLLDREQEYVQLSSLLQAQGVPRQAAEIFDEGLNREIIQGTRRNWEMVAGSWYEARNMEKALHAYEQAGAVSDDGKLDLQRAFILVNKERWEDALEALDRALEKGGLTETETGNAHLLTGMSHFNRGQFESAEQAFNQAANYGRLQSAAREWLNHIRQARERQAS